MHSDTGPVPGDRRERRFKRRRSARPVSAPSAEPVHEPLQPPTDPVEPGPLGERILAVAQESMSDFGHGPSVRAAHLREEEADQRIGVPAGDDRRGEVDDVRLPFGADQDVPAAEIAVRDAACVNPFEDPLEPIEEMRLDLAGEGSAEIPPGDMFQGDRLPVDPPQEARHAGEASKVPIGSSLPVELGGPQKKAHRPRARSDVLDDEHALAVAGQIDDGLRDIAAAVQALRRQPREPGAAQRLVGLV